jgi:hypothetical protein
VFAQSGVNLIDRKRVPSVVNLVCPTAGPAACDLDMGRVIEQGYKVLATDYDNYMIVYGCGGMMWDLLASPMLWIYTRRKIVTETERLALFAIIADKLPNYNEAFLFKGKNGGGCKYEATAS